MHIYKMLKECQKHLTPQQYRTLKGQVIAGDIEGALKGLRKLLRNHEGVKTWQKSQR